MDESGGELVRIEGATVWCNARPGGEAARMDESGGELVRIEGASVQVPKFQWRGTLGKLWEEK